ncbi:hypothetical protein [Chlorobaculum limnaeum]|uniref:hypothetical protein n=1 Tax=Chlorobaculum limnaeum TaxID=274537 RepID=UPI001969D033|nr:hypothetical protein [Chlorobaculum limnaeum]
MTGANLRVRSVLASCHIPANASRRAVGGSMQEVIPNETFPAGSMATEAPVPPGRSGSMS